MVDLNTIVSTDTQVEERKPVFIKYSPLLDPVRYMIGKYDAASEEIRTLPKSGKGISKLTSIHNASYIDGFFSFLASKLLHTHNIKHSADFYGSYLAVQKQFKMNILDDYEYLRDSDFFSQNTNKLFRLTKYTQPNDFSSDNSRNNRGRLNISDEVAIDDIILIETETIDPIDGENLEEVFNKTNVEAESNSDSDSDSDTDSNEDEDEDEDEDDEDEDEDEEEEEEEEEGDEDDGSESYSSGSEDDDAIYAYIDNFPVHMICLEKCNGTLDQLFEDNEVDEEIGASVLFQIIMTLIAFGKAFKFTHNDLHTNNIMYVNTDIEYLYYRFEGKNYKVPTYGKIFKIIDFGRGIYKFKGKTFCSDSFDTGGDAATQYNVPPFYNKKKPIIEPNPSFDLCRLGCSIYDFVIGDKKPTDDLQKTIHRWCLDDKGVSVLYKKNGEERYPDFKLYKMIARNVHDHTPKAQLEFPYFKQFLVKSIIDSNDIIDLDGVPDYSA
jgi:ribosomal protein L12E/L44/L45/RPP1/RPP2